MIAFRHGNIFPTFKGATTVHPTASARFPIKDEEGGASTAEMTSPAPTPKPEP
jgi:hypothetical protein